MDAQQQVVKESYAPILLKNSLLKPSWCSGIS
jgi:hypothetical protein